MYAPDVMNIATERGDPEPLAPDALRVIERLRDEAMFFIDTHGRAASWNAGVGAILGWEAEDWIGQPFFVVFTSEDVCSGVAEVEMSQAARDGHADAHRWMRRRSGEHFIALGSLTCLRSASGQVVGYLKTVRDVTALTRADNEFERRQCGVGMVQVGPDGRSDPRDAAVEALADGAFVGELRALANGIRDYAIFTLDTAGRIRSWCRGAELMKGYRADEAIGQHFSLLFTPEDRDRGCAEHEMAIAVRQGEFRGEGLRLRKDGSRFEAAVVLTALRDDRGRLRGFIKLTQDISQRRRGEREREAMLLDARAALVEAERKRHSTGEFMATISHELRTPLSAMLGWAQVLERGLCDPDTVKQGLGAISRNARLQGRLIEDLLDLNRIELGQLQLDLRRIDLGSVVAAAVESALPAALAKGVALHTGFCADGVTVMGDSARLLKLVGHLLSNAIKFTPAGGQVGIGMTRLEGHAQIAVADSGQGIEPPFLSRVFDRFDQQDGSVTRHHGGLGIGLAIVRHLAQLHGGTVQAQSEGLGHGATFTVVLPTVESRLDTARPDAAATAATRLDGVCILVVDDAPDVRAVTARQLQDAGASVVVAGGALEALRLLGQQPVDILLSDIGMPEIDGYELLRRVRRLAPDRGGNTLAVAYTAYTRAEDVAHAQAAGFQRHLAKPVSPAALVAAVALLVRSGPAGLQANVPFEPPPPHG